MVWPIAAPFFLTYNRNGTLKEHQQGPDLGKKLGICIDWGTRIVYRTYDVIGGLRAFHLGNGTALPITFERKRCSCVMYV